MRNSWAGGHGEAVHPPAQKSLVCQTTSNQHVWNGVIKGFRNKTMDVVWAARKETDDSGNYRFLH